MYVHIMGKQVSLKYKHKTVSFRVKEEKLVCFSAIATAENVQDPQKNRKTNARKKKIN